MLYNMKKGLKAILGFPFYIYKSYSILCKIEPYICRIIDFDEIINSMQYFLQLENIKKREKVFLYAGDIPEDTTVHENFIGLSLNKADRNL